MSTDEDDDDESQQVCANCVGESYLSNQIQNTGSLGFCSYCDDEANCIKLEELADHIEQAFERHFERTADEPDGWEYAMSKNGGPGWEHKGESAIWAISEAAKIDEMIAEDVRSFLAERHFDFDSMKVGEALPFDEDSHYAERDPGSGEFPFLWRDFEGELQTKTRFFSNSARDILKMIFGDLQNHQTTNGGTAIVNAGPNTQLTHLYRARIFRNEEHALNEALAYPWVHLGSPPAKLARAGRMNAYGISVFYGAKNRETAIAEVRPPVGSRAAVAKFDITRPLRLLDLHALTSVFAGGSIFDPSTAITMQRASFLAILSQKMSRPVMPHEEEFKYLSTQIVSEYLATELGLDGIIFPSVQAGDGSGNVVLFHHAARVREVSLPKGTEVSASLTLGDPEDPPNEYTVFEESPKQATESKKPGPRIPDFPADPSDSALDNRKDSLVIDLESIEVHYVKAVSISTDAFDVHRHRIERNFHEDGSDSNITSATSES